MSPLRIFHPTIGKGIDKHADGGEGCFEFMGDDRQEIMLDLVIVRALCETSDGPRRQPCNEHTSAYRGHAIDRFHPLNLFGDGAGSIGTEGGNFPARKHESERSRGQRSGIGPASMGR